MKLFTTSQLVRALYLLIGVAAMGVVVSNLFLRSSITIGPHLNPFVEAFFPIFFAGPPLLVAGSFIYGVIALAFEKDKDARKLLLGGLVLLLMIGYIASYTMFVTMPSRPPSQEQIDNAHGQKNQNNR